MDVRLDAAGQSFDGWSPHAEVGSQSGGEHDSGNEGRGEHGSGGEREGG